MVSNALIEPSRYLGEAFVQQLAYCDDDDDDTDVPHTNNSTYALAPEEE